jgi:hypothetical protein
VKRVGWRHSLGKPRGRPSCFIYYLFSQLGFPADDIIAAGANTLGGVFRNLTGELTANPFPRFKRLIDSYLPGTSTITSGNLDDPFPLKNLRSTPGEVLWHNSLTNETQIWFMGRHRVTGRATVLAEDGRPAIVGPPWSIVGAGDFKENGVPDIVWHNSATNETQIWFMGEGAIFNKITSRATVLAEDGRPAIVGPPWNIVGTGNSLTGDEREILWHNSSTNETQVWFMSRHSVTGRATVLAEDGRPAIVGPPWNIVGTSFIRPRALG